MDDLISRRVVIDMLSEQLDYLDKLDKYDNPTAVSQWYGINWARNRIADLQPERKKGKWEMVWNTFFHTELPKCTVCKNFEVYKTNFCPNCGADMREEKDNGKQTCVRSCNMS